MTQFPLSNIVSISASQTPSGAGTLNKSNLALFTRDVPGESFGTLGYGIYFSPTQVGLDFGTSSYTYLMAVAVFNQQPSIILPGGYLVVIPLTPGTTAIQSVTPSAVAASGSFILNYSGLFGGSTVPINWNDSNTVIQSKLQAIEALREVTVAGSIAAEDLVVTFTGVNGVAPALTVSSNTLETSAPAAITFTIATSTPGVAGETIAAAIPRTQNLVQYFGVMTAEYVTQADMLAAGALIQALAKQMFVVSGFAADVQPAGYLSLIQTGTLTQTRGLYYQGNTLLSMLQYMAAYASTGMSVVFTGTNTTITMNLKQLNSIQPDPNITDATWVLANTCGADTYVSFQGVAGVYCTGANQFYDQVYNLLAFSSDLQVAGFNYLAQTNTKIGQTEDGMRGYKAALRVVCQQYAGNQYLAPGAWTSPVFFGNQTLFLNNIANFGYFIYSAPVASQAPAVRVTRAAPLVQIAGKQAGAIQSSAILVNINP
jgi:hypothetical protein